MKKNSWTLSLIVLTLCMSTIACRRAASTAVAVTSTSAEQSLSMTSESSETDVEESALSSVETGESPTEPTNLSTNTLFSPTETPVIPTNTAVIPTNTAVIPTNTQVVIVEQSTLTPTGTSTETPTEAPTPTSTPLPATNTPVPTNTPAMPTAVPVNNEDYAQIPSSYTIKTGEYPYCIARRYNIDIFLLLDANGLDMSSRPSAGTQLTIPADHGDWTGERTLKEHPTTHTVTSGETVYSIACMYGDVFPEAIIKANSLTSPFTLSAGQIIHIP